MNALKTLMVLSIAAIASIPMKAGADSAGYAWADVIDAQPVTRIYRQPVETEVCWQEEVYREIPERRATAPAILGAIVGGVIGNQFGGGHGRDVMTVAGAALGHAVVKDNQHRAYPNHFEARFENRCGTNTDWQESRTVVGWDVTYQYDGITYQTRMQDEPGDRIKVRVNVEPVSN